MRRLIRNQYVLAMVWAMLLYGPNRYGFYLATTTGGTFAGSILNIHDRNAYLVSVRDGMQGDVWLGNLLFTTEYGLPQELNFIHSSLFYRLLGWFYGLTGLSINYFYIVVGYPLACIAFITYRRLFVACLESDREVQVATAFLVIFPGLLGINQLLQEFPILEDYISGRYLYAEGWGNPSMNPITHNCYMPHFVLANISVAILFRNLVICVRDKQRNYRDIAIAVFLVSWLLPTLGILWIAIIVTSIAYMSLVWRKSIPDTKLIFVSLVPGGIMSLWYSHFALRSDFWLYYFYKNEVMNGTIDVWLLILHVGVLGPMAVWSAYRVLRSDSTHYFGHVLSSIWLLFILIVSLGNFPGSARFMDGIYLPIIVLVSYAISHMSTISDNLSRLYYVIMAILILPGTFLTYVYPWYGHLYVHYVDKRVNLHSADIWPIRLSTSEMDMFSWIENNVGNNDVVVAGPVFANFIPAFSGSRVLLGHIGRTIDYHPKLHALQKIDVLGRLPALDNYDNIWVIDTIREPIGAPATLHTDTAKFSYCSLDALSVGDISVLQYTSCSD